MTPAFTPPARSPAHHGSRTRFMSKSGERRSKGEASDAPCVTTARPGSASWLDTLRTMARTARSFLSGRCTKDEQYRAALPEIDEADLSELGRQARREALREIRESERRAWLKAVGHRIGTPPT